MTGRVLITGSEGLIGTALCRQLAVSMAVVHFDLRRSPAQDVCRRADLEAALGGCTGVVHLAAVSRVVWGEREPDACRATNVGATRLLFELASASPRRPWVLVASSREVYGHPAILPATEDAPLAPVNVYGHTKCAVEALALEARAAGLVTAIARFSNVYGTVSDHPDRVVPAFAHAAALGDAMRLDGPASTFDFTHVDDVSAAIATLVDLLARRERALPPVHLVSGVATSLAELAELANRAGGGRSTLVHAAARSYDVARFVGDPARALQLLGWRARTPLADGVARLVSSFRTLAEQ